MTEALEFLRRLRPGGPWQLVAITPDRVGPRRGCRAVTAEAVERFIATHNQRRNLYYHLNRCRSGMIEAKASKSDISDIEFVHADLDPRVGESPSEAKARYRAALEASGLPPPSLLVDSGGGVQALWRVAPIAVEDPGSAVVLRVEGINAAIMRLLGCDDTSTHNIDRVLRVPGMNWPDRRKIAAGRVPVMARLISSHDGVQPLDCFPQPSVRGATTAPTEGNGGAAELDPLKHDWRAVVEKYRRRLKSARVRLMATERLTMPETNNRSRVIFMITADLYDAGASRDEIAAVVWRSPYFIDKKCQSIDRLENELKRIEDWLEAKGHK